MAELDEEQLREQEVRERQARGLCDFSRMPDADACPWYRGSLQGASWRAVSGSFDPFPDPFDLRCRLEVAAIGQGGWFSVEPADGWTIDQLTTENLRTLFGGGRLFKASIRWKGNTVPGSTERFDLTTDSTPPKPIPGDRTPPQVEPPKAARAPTSEPNAHVDPLSMLLGDLPPQAKGGVLLAMQFAEKDAQRQSKFYEAALELHRLNASAPNNSADLVRRLEADLGDARRERDTLRSEKERLTAEVYELRQRMALMQALGPAAAQSSPVFDAITGVLKSAAPELMKGIAARVDPNQLVSLATRAMERLPPETIAGALNSAGGMS